MIRGLFEMVGMVVGRVLWLVVLAFCAGVAGCIYDAFKR
jgi:hypothetical protein